MKEKIGYTEVFWLTVAIILPTAILMVPVILGSTTGRLGWLSVLIAGIVISLINYGVLKQSCKYSNQGVITDCTGLFGSIFGKLIALLYLLIIIGDTIIINYEVVDFITVVMPYKKEEYFFIGVALLVLYLARTGIENISRVSEIGIILMMITILSISIYVQIKPGLANLSYLKPMTFDLYSLVRGFFSPADWFELTPIVLLSFKPFFNDVNKAIKASVFGIIFSQIAIIVLFIVSLSVFDMPLFSRLTFPYYTLSKMTQRGLEVFIFIAWLVGVVLKLGIFYYASVLGIAEIFGIKNYKKLLLPFLICITTLSIISLNLSLASRSISYYSVVLLPIETGLLLFFIIAYFIKLRHKEGAK